MSWWEALGWLGNVCFFSRFAVHWWYTERKRSNEAPMIFWLLSIAGSLCLGFYAAQRGVPVLLVGYLANGLIYLRNLRIQRGRRPVKPLSMGLVTGIAIAAIVALVSAGIVGRAIDPKASLFWIGCAVVGQAIWSSRFVAQWWVSEQQGVSHFPAVFWWFSLAGNLMLLSYALHLRDAVFIAGLALGPVIQIRNLVIASSTPMERIAPVAIVADNGPPIFSSRSTGR